MHGLCFEFDLQEWFNFRIPSTSIPSNYIEEILFREEFLETKDYQKVFWTGVNAA